MTPLTTKQGELLNVINMYETLKEQMKVVRTEMNLLLTEVGEGTYFQNPEDDIVYKIIVPTGTYVEFNKIGYNRTKKVEEKKGSLSKKEAVEQGFEL